ncbi:MAG: hypothetical protein ACOCR0_00770 [Haloferacaceae archaeon]
MAVSDPDEVEPGDELEEDTAASEVRWSGQNWLLITLFIGLTVLGVAISTGELGSEFVDAPDDGWNAPVTVPPFVYLYASLGALGYIFTRLITRLEDFVEWGDIEKLVTMALRIPAAWILAAGVYLFVPVFVPENANNAWFTAGMAFLVGLYVNVAFKALGALAERLLGRTFRTDAERRDRARKTPDDDANRQ